MTKSSLRSNIILSVVAQGLSLAASFLLGLIVPKYVEINQYAYWQTFILYTGYIGILHFGLLDGIVLRYSKYDYADLSKPLIRSQLCWLLVFLTIPAIVCCACSFFFSDDSSRAVCFLVGINIVITNLFYYASYVYQVTNEIPKYITIVIVERVAHVLLVVILLFLKVKSFQWYCIAQMVGSVTGILFSIYKNSEIYWGKLIPIKDSIVELKENVSAGAKLLAANWSAMFLVGGAKTFIQWHWDIVTFGYISFSFSLTSLFLSFITAVSVVFFPALKRTSNSRLNNLYPKLRLQMTSLLILMLASFYVIEYLLPLWLPQYDRSIKYFGMILPIVIFNSRLSLLTNNYLKVFRQEGKMFIINAVTLVLAVIGYVPCTYYFDSLDMVVYWAVIVIIIRAVWSEIKLRDYLNKSFIKETIVEVGLCVIFVLSLQFHNRLIGASLYLVTILIYFIYMISSPNNRKLLLNLNDI